MDTIKTCAIKMNVKGIRRSKPLSYQIGLALADVVFIVTSTNSYITELMKL